MTDPVPDSIATLPVPAPTEPDLAQKIPVYVPPAPAPQLTRPPGAPLVVAPGVNPGLPVVPVSVPSVGSPTVSIEAHQVAVVPTIAPEEPGKRARKRESILWAEW